MIILEADVKHPLHCIVFVLVCVCPSGVGCGSILAVQEGTV